VQTLPIVFGFVLLVIVCGVHGLVLRKRAKTAALSVHQAGFVLAAFVIVAGAIARVTDPIEELADLRPFLIQMSVSLLLLALAAWIAARLLLGGKTLALLEGDNLAAGLASAANSVGLGVLVSKVDLDTTMTAAKLSIGFLLLGCVFQQGCVAVFRAFTVYDDREQIEGGNAAAALSYSGMSLGSSLIAARALDGELPSFSESMVAFVSLLLTSFAFLPLRQLLVQSLFLGGALSLRGGILDDRVGHARDIGAASLEFATYVGLGVAVFALA
jgi:uncharacterized membrane protein YjfL (UPF0719 family)